MNEFNFFIFGIGVGVNRYLLEGMVYVGMGELLIIIVFEGVYEKVEDFR